MAINCLSLQDFLDEIIDDLRRDLDSLREKECALVLWSVSESAKEFSTQYFLYKYPTGDIDLN